MAKNDLRTWRAIAARQCPMVAPFLFAATYIEEDDMSKWPPQTGDKGTFMVNPDTLTVTYSPKFAASQTPEENAYVLAHEGWHVICDHVKRRFDMKAKEGINFDHELFDYAAEFAVNALCQQVGGFTMPQVGVQPVPEYIPLSTEEIYYELKKKYPGRKPHICKGCIDPNATGTASGSGAELLKQQVQDGAAREAQAQEGNGQQAGNQPGELKRLLLGMRKFVHAPDWKDLLKRYLIALDFSCKHFDPASIYRRRQDIDGLVVPNLSSQPAGRKFVLSIDNSGSVSDPMWMALKGVMHSVAQQLGFQEIVVQHFTSEVIATERVNTLSALEKVARRGDGGTCIEDCDRKAALERPEFHVILTDGYVSHWLNNYSVPTVIVRTCADSTTPSKVRNMIADVLAKVDGD